MPDLDVSPAIESSFLSDPITIIRRSNAVGFEGRVGRGKGPQPIGTYQAFGVVTPSRPTDLKRLSDEQVQQNSIHVVTEFTLQGATDANGQPQAPDLIIYNGNTFQVADISDYTNWGMSWTDAVCVMTDPQPAQAPAQTYQGATVPPAS